ncbi:Ger(x)C family spore germination protein [Gorillibacterium sp. CAU 1737]|uniref:Ger(x)C family spore germination protein n=1 Tax=Gorillibacterium sp. CAU 1737 TaxID=3140362 RepID=UPI0032607C28
MDDGGKRKGWVCLFVIAGMAGLLTGCWSGAAIEDRNLDIGVAFDLVEPGGDEVKQKPIGSTPEKPIIQRTVQFALPQSGGSSGGSESSGAPKTYFNLEQTGESILEIIREVNLRANSSAGFHLKSIIISSKLLEKFPMHDLLDFLLADNDVRLSPQVFISTGKAADALRTTTVPDQIPAISLRDILKNRNKTARLVKPMTLAKIIGPLRNESSFVLPNVLTANKQVKIAGAGIIKGGSQTYGGYLTEKEVEGLQWLRGEVKGGIVKCKPSPGNQPIQYEVLSANSKIKAMLRKGKLSFRVSITTSGRLSESYRSVQDKGNPGLVHEIEKETAKEIQALAQGTVDRMHHLHVEVAGFGNALRLQNTKKWREVKPQWDEEFGNIPIRIEAKVRLVDQGASTMSAE